MKIYKISIAFLLLCTSITALLSLIFVSPGSISSSNADITNILGPILNYSSFWMFRCFGIGAWLIPVIFFAVSYDLLIYHKKYFIAGLIFCSFTILISVFFHLFANIFKINSFSDVYSMGLGGAIGSYICKQLFPFFNYLGSALILIICISGTTFIFIYYYQDSNFLCIKYISKIIVPFLNWLCDYINKIRHFIYSKICDIIKYTKNFRISKKNSTTTDTNTHITVEQCNTSNTIDVDIDDENRNCNKQFKIKINDSLYNTTADANTNQKLTVVASEELTPVDTPLHKINTGSSYIFPSIELLERSQNQLAEDDDCEQVFQRLINVLKQFGIDATPTEIHKGPVITRYELVPAAGIRVEKIANLDKNIALGLEARSVRIIAPVPGKGCVGIEIPNKVPASVRLREILESKAWSNMKAAIPVVLGRGVTGEPIICDLAKMPHLLIAGATGAGKTVCINTIIASLVFHASPDDLRFIMVDPKIVEMQCFNNLPHMLIPVVTDPKKVPNALKWLITEMEDRYHIFATVGVRNIANYNEKLPQLLVAYQDDPKIKKMPYIVCIIDELADLMMVAPGDIETGIARLAQLARAAGIHLILATQRPSVNVITGIIKANLPCRIAFKVSSKVDSRTILDTGGAEALLGQGDMLFSPPGAFGLQRTQGAFVSDEEINAVVQFLYDNNGGPQIEESIQNHIDAGGNEDEVDGNNCNWDDELIPKALDIIRTHDRASTSFLQRKLKIGYNRAARIMDTLREQGLVGHSDFEE